MHQQNEMNALLLGISISGGCLTHCGTVLLPILFCERNSRIKLTTVFMLARLIGYFLFSVVSYLLVSKLPEVGILNSPFFHGVLTIAIAVILLRYAWNLHKELHCSKGCSSKKGGFLNFRKGAFSYALRMGLLTGLNLCAPFVALLATEIDGDSFIHTTSSFLLFYLGTTVLLLPIMLTGCLRPPKAIQQIGFITCIGVSALYLLQGSLMIIGGIYA